MRKFKVKGVVFVFSFLAALTGAAVIFPFVPLPVSIFFLFSSIFAVWREIRNLKGDVIDRRILNLIALAGTFFLFSRISLENLVVPVASVLMFLLSIKFIEDKRPRDFYQILALSLFQFAAASVFLFSIRFLLFFVLEAFLIISAAVLVSFLTLEEETVLSVRELGYIFGFSGVFFSVSLPLTLFFFFILPRTETPLVDVGIRSSMGVTGFSDTVAPGQVSSIQQINAVFMRVKTEKLPFNPYFRAITYERLMNGKWFHVHLKFGKKGVVRGKAIKETVILEPYGFRNLPVVDIPVSVNLKDIHEENNCFFLNRPVTRRIRYTGVSVLSNVIKEKLSDREKKFYLELPVMPAVRDFVEKVFGNVSKADMPEALLIFFRKNFSYTLKNLPSSVEDFLLNERRGSCEYFASAAAIIFRLKGIPARLVGGFYGGEYNPYGGYYIVRDRNAHVWVEYYENGGWHRFEPTFGQVKRKSGNGSRDFIRKNRGKLLDKLKLILDALNYYWINFVINYDFSMQVNMAMKVRSKFSGLLNFATSGKVFSNKYILIYLFFGLIIFIFILFVKAKKTIIDEFYDLMRHKGYKRLRNEPLEVFVKRIDDEDLRKKAEEFVRIYEEKFYKDEPICCAELERLREILNELKENDFH